MRVISGTVATMAFDAVAPPQNNPRQRFNFYDQKSKKAGSCF
jgi:hypothetical protein